MELHALSTVVLGGIHPGKVPLASCIMSLAIPLGIRLFGLDPGCLKMLTRHQAGVVLVGSVWVVVCNPKPINRIGQGTR